MWAHTWWNPHGSDPMAGTSTLEDPVPASETSTSSSSASVALSAGRCSSHHRTGRPLHPCLRHSGPTSTESAAAAKSELINGASRGGAPATPPPPRWRRRRGGPPHSRVARPAGEHRSPGGRRARGEERLRGPRGWGDQFERRDQGLLPPSREGDPPRRRRRRRFPTLPSDPRRL